MTRTALCIALLIALQAFTAGFNTPLLTGSIVNLLLIVAVMTGGMASGLAVAVVSPVMAKVVGIGPLWSLIPWIVAGNVFLVTVWHVIGNRWPGRRIGPLAAIPTAALAKSLVLYIGIVRVAIPLFLHLPEPQAAVISQMFSLPQLFTSLLGGAAAMLVVPPVRKALAAWGDIVN